GRGDGEGRFDPPTPCRAAAAGQASPRPFCRRPRRRFRLLCYALREVRAAAVGHFVASSLPSLEAAAIRHSLAPPFNWQGGGFRACRAGRGDPSGRATPGGAPSKPRDSSPAFKQFPRPRFFVDRPSAFGYPRLHPWPDGHFSYLTSPRGGVAT